MAGKSSPTLNGMYKACMSLQKRHIEALSSGDGRGMSTLEMAEHLERESGIGELYKVLEGLEVNAWGRDIPKWLSEYLVKAVLAMAKARGERPSIE